MTELTPEVRKELVNHLAHASQLWIEDIMKNFFGDCPNDPRAQQMMIEALSRAICATAQRVPSAPSLLHTFALEVLDNIQDHNEGI